MCILLTRRRCTNINSERICSYVINCEENICCGISSTRITMYRSISILGASEFKRSYNQFYLITKLETMICKGDNKVSIRCSVCCICWSKCSYFTSNSEIKELSQSAITTNGHCLISHCLNCKFFCLSKGIDRFCFFTSNVSTTNVKICSIYSLIISTKSEVVDCRLKNINNIIFTISTSGSSWRSI